MVTVKAWWQDCLATGLSGSEGREQNDSVSFCFLLYTQSRILAQGLILPTSREVFLPQLNLLEDIDIFVDIC